MPVLTAFRTGVRLPSPPPFDPQQLTLLGVSFFRLAHHTAVMLRITFTLMVCLATFSAAGFPEAILKQPAAWYRTEDGRKTTACVLSWQSQFGSWPKAKDTARKMNPDAREKIKGTFDNKSTTDELRYLSRAFQATNDDVCKTAFLLEFDHILKAQYPNGGWPLLFPFGKMDYPRRISFNDNTMVRLMQFHDQVTTDDAYSWVDSDRRTAARAAVGRGIECIIKCQIIIAGKPTVWCAQHDEVTYAPALARAYELSSLSGSESAGILRYLMKIPNPSPAIIQCVQDGVAWFASAKIEGMRIEKINGDRQMIADATAPPLWARFYDLETGRPFICDRDGMKKSRLSDIGKERRNGYAWYGTWGDPLFKVYAKWPHR